MSGKLYLCATPIGNLGDITYRAAKILGEVDLIAAEDTRQTAKLLNHLQIKKPMISYHEHNKAQKGNELIEQLNSGKNIALVTDAGMPAISDPGEDLVKLCIANNIDIVPLPGPSASLTALILSGLDTRRFCFEGFLPSTKKDRRTLLEKLKTEERTIIIYESPHRLLATLQDIKDIIGNKNISISRELTKIYEETYRSDIEGAIKYFEQKGTRGEFVLVLEGISLNELEHQKSMKWENITIEDHITMYINQGYTKKDSIKQVALDRNMPKKEVYLIGINL